MDLATFAESAVVPLVEPSVLNWILMQSYVQRHGTWVEFGVGSGDSFRIIASADRGTAKLWGLDSFIGLPEDWNETHPKGRFATNRVPLINGTQLLVGLFADTLPVFMPSEPVTFGHLDCDLYSSGMTCLRWLATPGRLAEGAVLVIDDFFTAPYENGLMRALYEMQPWFHVSWLARCGDTMAIKVT
jgi:hypothetical protein